MTAALAGISYCHETDDATRNDVCRVRRRMLNRATYYTGLLSRMDLMKTEADRALEERARQITRYRKLKAAEWREAMATDVALGQLAGAIGRCKDADEMIGIAKWCAEWIVPGCHFLVLGLISKRIQALRRRSGLPEIDDPLPGDKRDADDCWQRCREILT